MDKSQVNGGIPVPSALKDVITAAEERLGADSAAGQLLGQCMLNSWQTAVRRSTAYDEASPDVFVITGDIDAMWLRDSAAQLRPYLVAARDADVYDVLAGTVLRHARNVLIDPYANGFNDGPTGAHGDPNDIPTPGDWIWERKYELDSLCAPLHFGYALWKASGRSDHLDATFRKAVGTILDVWETEQDHATKSQYTFIRPEGPFAHDTLPNDGKGGDVAHTGMTWSGFRPSDDRCEYGYLIPANAMASAGLQGLAEIAEQVWHDEELVRRARALSEQIDEGILRHGIHVGNDGMRLTYEVDGLGGVNDMDDANLPSLLGLPLTGWITPDDAVYQRTRRFVLSDENPYWYSGADAEGVGSPHTPDNHVWPIALAVAGLTGTPDERLAAAERLAATTGGTGLMHESFHVDDPSVFTRPWFGWANAMFAELMLAIAGFDIQQFYPKHPKADAWEWEATAEVVK